MKDTFLCQIINKDEDKYLVIFVSVFLWSSAGLQYHLNISFPSESHIKLLSKLLSSLLFYFEKIEGKIYSKDFINFKNLRYQSQKLMWFINETPLKKIYLSTVILCNNRSLITPRAACVICISEQMTVVSVGTEKILLEV